MYIWVAVDVSEQVQELREQAESYVKEKGLSSTTFTLPFHISLKISFRIPDDRFEEAVDDIRTFYKSLKPFEIRVKGIEQSGPIVWITMQESAELSNIHEKLDEMFYSKYDVTQHDFDKNFRFHTSVLMINNKEQITKAFDELKDIYVPKTLMAKRFIIGSSVEGRPGTYSVYEEIEN